MLSRCEYPPHVIPHCRITELSHAIPQLFRPIALVAPHAVYALSNVWISLGEGQFHMYPTLGKRLRLFTGRVFPQRGFHVVEHVDPVLRAISPATPASTPDGVL